MQKYFFHIFDASGETIDEEGNELPDDTAARKWAIEGIRSIISEEVLNGMIDLLGRVEITDGTGNPVITVPFDEAVIFSRDPGATPPSPSAYDR